MNSTFFRGNREKIMAQLGSSIVVITANKLLQSANDTSFRFQQEANFWYLTGIDEPDWWVIIDHDKSWLVSPEVDEVHQVFSGSLPSQEAKKISGVDDVISRDEARDILQHMARTHQDVYTLGADPHAKHYDFVLNPADNNMRTYLRKIFSDVRDCRLDLARLRSIKQPAEIVALKKAIKLTCDSFGEIKPRLKKLQYEYEVEAEFTYRFRSAGAPAHAYDPIVASSAHAVTLHYNANSEPLKNNSLLLLDIGARVDGYAADITRTYAVGTPTKRHQQVHAAVELAQQQIIQLIRPGLKLAKYQASVDVIMMQALLSLGLMKSIEDTTSYRKYFPHSIGHGLGIDVHDSLAGASELLPGMVMTVEPGIYIPEEGIGVRIEDDILITQTSHQNLSGSLPTSL